VVGGAGTVVATDFGFGTALLGVTCIAVTDGADEVSDVTFDAENSKLLPVDEAGAYVSGDLSGASVRLLAWGI